MISIWYFIGISLAVNGALICAAGIYELLKPPAETTIALYHLHANVWWGAVLLLVGLLFCFKFRKSHHPEL